jgi:hypothetical protein
MERVCASCGRSLADDFRFCPNCGLPQRVKIIEHFRGMDELDDGWLRVSVYLAGTRHIRFSVWRNDEAKAAMSLPPDEARRLAAFLDGMVRQPDRRTYWASQHSVTRALGASLRGLLDRARL